MDEGDPQVARWLAPLSAAAAVASLAYAAIAYCHAPTVPDFYRLIYHDPTRRRGEGTAEFLFVFPLLLTLGCLLTLARGRGWWGPSQRVGRPSPGGQLFLSLLVIAVFLIGSLHRSWLVLHRFG